MSIANLLRELIDAARARNPNSPALIGVSGAQGSGKSYQCKQFAAANSRVAYFSLDDVYLTRAERETLAARVHPLFITRGPPGTHDLELARRTIEMLRAGKPCALPRFDKARDDRAPEETWPLFVGPAEAILIDGWCLGATPPEDGEAINGIEREDAHGMWRRRVRSELATNYAPFFAAFDAIAYLKAPSWEIVKRWRAEQEIDNLGRALTPEDHARLDRFMQHYERITRSMMAGGHVADWVVALDEGRNAVPMEAGPP